MMDSDREAPKPPVGRTTAPRNPDDPAIAHITPEEVKAYKECMNGMFLKAGLPFAAIMHFLNSSRVPSEPQQQQQQQQQQQKQHPQFRSQLVLKRAFLFFGNMVLGSVLFSPVCYRSLLKMREKVEKKTREDVPYNPSFERTQPSRLPDDYTYPTDLTSNLNEAESTFTSELSPSKILANEDEPIKISQRTTYQDLRRQHRSTFDTSPEPPPSHLKVPVEKPVAEEPPVEKEPRKFVRRNKYGDEIE